MLKQCTLCILVSFRNTKYKIAITTEDGLHCWVVLHVYISVRWSLTRPWRTTGRCSPAISPCGEARSSVPAAVHWGTGPYSWAWANWPCLSSHMAFRTPQRRYCDLCPLLFWRLHWIAWISLKWKAWLLKNMMLLTFQIIVGYWKQRLHNSRTAV